jgi:hypothetical protein
MPPTGFEPTIPASERPQTHAFDRVVTAISNAQYNKTFCNQSTCWVRLLLPIYRVEVQKTPNPVRTQRMCVI